MDAYLKRMSSGIGSQCTCSWKAELEGKQAKVPHNLVIFITQPTQKLTQKKCFETSRCIHPYLCLRIILVNFRCQVIGKENKSAEISEKNETVAPLVYLKA